MGSLKNSFTSKYSLSLLKPHLKSFHFKPLHFQYYQTHAFVSKPLHFSIASLPTPSLESQITSLLNSFTSICLISKCFTFKPAHLKRSTLPNCFTSKPLTSKLHTSNYCDCVILVGKTLSHNALYITILVSLPC